MYIEKKKMVDVTDDWYPNYPNNQIFVKIALIYNENAIDGTFPGQVYIWAEGMDDDYMELRYAPNYAFLDDLENKYNHWKQVIYGNIPNKVNHKWFYDNGFCDSSGRFKE